MTLTVTTRGAIQLIQPIGTLDEESVDGFSSTVAERLRPGGQIVIDLSATEHINSAGISALVNAAAQGNVQECRVVLAGPTPQVAGVLEITKLNRFFEIAPSVEDALGRFGASGG